MIKTDQSFRCFIETREVIMKEFRFETIEMNQSDIFKVNLRL